MTIAANACKKTANSKVGLSFSKKGMDAPLLINAIREDSIFASTGLAAGMIVKVNWLTLKRVGEQ